MKELMQKKVIPALMKAFKVKPFVAIKDGLIYIMPLTIIGSVFMLLGNFPYKPVSDFIYSLGWGPYLSQVTGATFDLMALVSVAAIAYTYVKNEGYEPLPASIIGIVSLIVLNSSTVTDQKSGVVIGSVIDKAWMGGKGMITAIIVGLAVGAAYSWFLHHDIRLKLPEQVPEGVSNSFSSLIPGMVIVTGAVIIYAIFNKLFNMTLVESVYKAVQVPLQGVSDSLGGVIFMCLVISGLWWFGIHGSNIIYNIMTPLLTANTLDNKALLDAGQVVSVANGGHIVTQQFLDLQICMGAAGITIGLVVYFTFFAKSRRYRQFGKMALIPNLFVINEPVMFATPIVLNPVFLLPFIAMPLISGIVTYAAMASGLVPLFTGVSVPWTCPPVISGYLACGWQLAVLQALILIISFVVYLPFARKVDMESYYVENGQ